MARIVAVLALLALLALLGLWLWSGRERGFRGEIATAHPPDRVFRWLVDPARLTRWIEGLVESRPLGDGALRVGARSVETVEERGRRVEMASEVLALEHGRSLEVSLESAALRGTNRFDLLPDSEGGTRVRQELRVRYRGFVRLFGPFLDGTVQRKLDADLARLASGLDEERVRLRGADHHMHPRSTTVTRAWKAYCAATGQEHCLVSQDDRPQTTAEDALADLDDAGIEKGALLSLAYFFGSPVLERTEWDSAELVRQENRFVVEEAQRHASRLVPFVSVNPLLDYAVEEVRYWAATADPPGLKLHLANSRVDLGDPAHVGRLAELFALAEGAGMPILVHLRAQEEGYGRAAVEPFLEKVLPRAPTVPVVVAHLGGWGGYDAATAEAMDAFIGAVEAHPPRLGSNVFFDVVAAFGGPPSPAAERRTAQLRRLGLERLLFGSDWNHTGTPRELLAFVRERAGLDDPEWAAFRSRQAPFFDPPGRGAPVR